MSVQPNSYRFQSLDVAYSTARHVGMSMVPSLSLYNSDALVRQGPSWHCVGCIIHGADSIDMISASSLLVDNDCKIQNPRLAIYIETDLNVFIGAEQSMYNLF